MAKILVVDDEEGIREFLADALTDDGHDVTQASDGLAAIQRLHERAFDVMVTDLRMPGALDGVDVLRKAKADQPELEVIVLTAYGTVDTAVDAMKLGAFDYLQKPLGSPAELRLIVARAIERRRLLSMQDAATRFSGSSFAGRYACTRTRRFRLANPAAMISGTRWRWPSESSITLPRSSFRVTSST
jgi:two-component system response regulator FlrC